MCGVGRRTSVPDNMFDCYNIHSNDLRVTNLTASHSSSCKEDLIVFLMSV